jgi:taurine dioxygenase
MTGEEAMAVTETALKVHHLFDARPLQPSLGAQISGIDLTEPLAPEVRDALWAALLTHRVLFFRDQDLTREQQIAFGQQFGDLESHPIYSLPDYPNILALIATETKDRHRTGADGNWHADSTFLPAPPAASILRGIIVPPLGGDTVFVNVIEAYERLPEEVKERIDGLTALHDSRIYAGALSGEERDAFLAKNPPAEHPVVRVHPETGEKAIYVNTIYTKRIVGVSEAESDQLLQLLFNQLKRPEFQMRWSWTPNSMAFWDNRSSQHYAVGDYREQRHMERITIVGDVPMGPSTSHAMGQAIG